MADEPQSLDELEAEAIAQEEAEADLAAQVEALTAERDEFKDRFMRALADAENSRKRAERDRREGELYGATRLARDLLSIYDNLRRALDVADEATRAQNPGFVEGIDLTMKEVLSVFGKHGVKVISPAVGDRFDPAIHEAMFEAPLPGTKAGDIIQVSMEGFMLNDRLLRPAQVGVSSMPLA